MLNYLETVIWEETRKNKEETRNKEKESMRGEGRGGGDFELGGGTRKSKMADEKNAKRKVDGDSLVV